METKEIVRQFAIYFHNLPIWFDNETKNYKSLFGNQTFTFDEIYEDFLTTLKQ
jgi:hypothetical protein